MRCTVATRRGRLNVRSGPGLTHPVVSQLNKGTGVEVVESRQGWSRLARGGWVSAQYLSPDPSQPQPQRRNRGGDRSSATAQGIANAEWKLISFIRWHNPPQAEAGMGGIAPGESRYGRTNYPYLNWLNAYYATVDAFLRGQPRPVALQAWPNLAIRLGILVEQGGRNGALKADTVWAQIPAHVRDAIVLDYEGDGDVYERVTTKLKKYVESEVQRLGVPRDYGIVDLPLGIW